VERPVRPAPQAANRFVGGRADIGGRGVAFLRDPVVGVAGHDSSRTDGRTLAVRWQPDAVHWFQRVRGRHYV